MAFQQKDMSGVLFQNDKKEKGSHPDKRGDALIDGVSYWVKAWENEARSGIIYMSLQFERKDAEPPSRSGSTAKDIDDEIPF